LIHRRDLHVDALPASPITLPVPQGATLKATRLLATNQVTTATTITATATVADTYAAVTRPRIILVPAVRTPWRFLFKRWSRFGILHSTVVCFVCPDVSVTVSILKVTELVLADVSTRTIPFKGKTAKINFNHIYIAEKIRLSTNKFYYLKVK
jgi:hypothetical protein